MADYIIFILQVQKREFFQILRIATKSFAEKAEKSDFSPVIVLCP